VRKDFLENKKQKAKLTGKQATDSSDNSINFQSRKFVS
jgi:hypothetical protein